MAAAVDGSPDFVAAFMTSVWQNALYGEGDGTTEFSMDEMVSVFSLPMLGVDGVAGNSAALNGIFDSALKATRKVFLDTKMVSPREFEEASGMFDNFRRKVRVSLLRYLVEEQSPDDETRLEWEEELGLTGRVTEISGQAPDGPTLGGKTELVLLTLFLASLMYATVRMMALAYLANADYTQHELAQQGYFEIRDTKNVTLVQRQTYTIQTPAGMNQQGNMDYHVSTLNLEYGAPEQYLKSILNLLVIGLASPVMAVKELGSAIISSVVSLSLTGMVPATDAGALLFQNWAESPSRTFDRLVEVPSYFDQERPYVVGLLDTQLSSLAVARTYILYWVLLSSMLRKTVGVWKARFFREFPGTPQAIEVIGRLAYWFQVGVGAPSVGIEWAIKFTWSKMGNPFKTDWTGITPVGRAINLVTDVLLTGKPTDPVLREELTNLEIAIEQNNISIANVERRLRDNENMSLHEKKSFSRISKKIIDDLIKIQAKYRLNTVQKERLETLKGLRLRLHAVTSNSQAARRRQLLDAIELQRGRPDDDFGGGGSRGDGEPRTSPVRRGARAKLPSASAIRQAIKEHDGDLEAAARALLN